MADLICFWFCKDTIQPITLFELGKYYFKKMPDTVFVGIEFGYPREADVIYQIEFDQHPLGNRAILRNLDEMAMMIKWEMEFLRK
jgi:hypothetical protein